MSKGNFAALDERGVVEVEAARARPVAGTGNLQVFQFPAKRKTQRVVEFGTLAVRKRKLLEATDEPRKRIFAAAGCIEPTLPGDVGFDVSVFLQKRNEAWPDRAAGALGLVVIPIIVPGDVDVAPNAAHQPLRNIEGERVLHGGTGDPGGIEVIEQGHVSIGVAEFLDAYVKGVKEAFDAGDLRWRVRKGTQE